MDHQIQNQPKITVADVILEIREQLKDEHNHNVRAVILKRAFADYLAKGMPAPNLGAGKQISNLETLRFTMKVMLSLEIVFSDYQTKNYDLGY